MALATRCPHCQTTFRVAPEQLKLRAGLVRCGACKEIFNGVENLVARTAAGVPPPEKPLQANPAAVAATASAAAALDPGVHAAAPATSQASAEEPTATTASAAGESTSAPTENKPPQVWRSPNALPAPVAAPAQDADTGGGTDVGTDVGTSAPTAAAPVMPPASDPGSEQLATPQPGVDSTSVPAAATAPAAQAEPASALAKPPSAPVDTPSATTQNTQATLAPSLSNPVLAHHAEPAMDPVPAAAAEPEAASTPASAAGNAANDAAGNAANDAAGNAADTAAGKPADARLNATTGPTPAGAPTAPAPAPVSATPWPIPRQATPPVAASTPAKPSVLDAPTRIWPAPPFFTKKNTAAAGRTARSGPAPASQPGKMADHLARTPGGSKAAKDARADNKAAATNAATKVATKAPDPMLRMTLVDLATIMGGDKAGHASTADNGDALNRAMDELRKSPWRGLRIKGPDEEADFLDAHDEPEPEFVLRARRQQRFGRLLRNGLAAGTVLLALLMVAQTTLYYRNQIAAWMPHTAPGLTRLCNVLGCTLGLPAQIDAVSIESSELQVLSSSQNTYALVALLRNRSAVNQSWPAIELTINDNEDKPSVRRVFAPAEYLSPGQTTAQGLLGNSEQPVRIVLTLSQGKAAGYRVYLFYP